MSDYAAGYTNPPVVRRGGNEHAHLEYVEGTLFEFLDEAHEITTEAKRRLGATVLTSAVSQEFQPKFSAPKAVELWRGQPEPEDDEPDSLAYHELGGTRGADKGLYEVLQRYQPWMRDITVGVERYGLLEMTPGDVAKMTVRDKDILSLYVDGYAEGIKSVRRLIATHEGDIAGHDFLKKYIHDGTRPTSVQMLQYSQDLAVFERQLMIRGAYPALVAHTQEKHGGDTEWGRARRHKIRRDNKTRKKNTPAVHYDNDTAKWRVELLPSLRD